jgi:hypothetical protein
VDISAYIDQKMDAILAYTTQFFNPALNEPATYISSPQFLNVLKGRDAMLGKRIGVEYAEGFITEKTIGISSFDAIIQKTT